MRCYGGPVNDAVSRVPSSTVTDAIHEHLDSALHAQGRQLETATSARQLVEGEDREGGRHNPTGRIRKPRPAELVRIESNMAISSAEFPLPEPIALFARVAQQPMKTLQASGYSGYEVTKSDRDQRC